jgi:GDP-L-fucose synthase
MNKLDILSPEKKIFVAGHRGLAGSAVIRSLLRQGFKNLILRTHQELDLRNQAATQTFFETEKPDVVFLCAAKVGGILANDRFRGDFILENLQIQTNVISSAFSTQVQKLVFLGSSCIYPKFAQQPISEGELLTGLLEPTNDAYAVAKIAGLMLCQSLMKQYGRSFISVMPTNLYGPGDNYDLNNSHVLPALIRKFHEAKVSGVPTVTCWGTGSPQREFMYSDDLGDAVAFCAQHYSDPQHINIGSEQELTIKELAERVAEIVGFRGETVWDSSKPDGTPRKRMDSSKLHAMGWRPKFTLQQGIALSYQDFLSRTS